MGGGEHRHTQRLFALGMPAPDGTLVMRIPKTVATCEPMVLVPMKAPHTVLLPALAMKHVAMNEPFACIRVNKAQWESDHFIPQQERDHIVT